MTLQYKVMFSLIALLVAFAFGRYSATKPAVSTQTQINTKQQVHENVHEVVVTTKAPDGTTKTTETIDTVAQIQTQQQTNTITQVSKQSKINISALIANDFSRGVLLPLYGISVNKEFIGPITVGAFGLTNGTIGVSIGLNF